MKDNDPVVPTRTGSVPRERHVGIAELYECHRERCYQLALGILGSHLEAEGALHRAVVNLPVDFLARVPPGRRPRYLTVAVRREALSVLRARDRRFRLTHRGAETLSCPAGGPEEEVARREVRNVLETMVDQLPDRCGRVVRLVYFNGLSHAEVAEHLGIKTSAVEKQVARGRRFLRAMREAAMLHEAWIGVSPGEDGGRGG